MTVKCPHCGVEIDDWEDMAGEVVNCPSCNGEFQLPKKRVPVAKAVTEPESVRGHVTTEKTSKSLKLQFLANGIIMFFSVLIGLLAACAGAVTVTMICMLVFFATLVIYLILRVKRWWNHG